MSMYKKYKAFSHPPHPSLNPRVPAELNGGP
jgi:hypothetical protein